MELESTVFARLRSRLSLQDECQDIPEEYKLCTVRALRQMPDLADRIFTFALICTAAAAFLPFFMTPFSKSVFRMRASPLEGQEGLGFVTFLGDVEDLSGAKTKDMFGWGGLDLVYRAGQALAPQLQSCRANLRSTQPSPGFAFRFDAKVDVAKPGFVITGLIDGQDVEPEVATCLRDKINSLQIADFANLRAASPKSYKLRLGVQLAHGSDGGAP